MVALTSSGDLFVHAKDLFVCAKTGGIAARPRQTGDQAAIAIGRVLVVLPELQLHPARVRPIPPVSAKALIIDARIGTSHGCTTAAI